MKQTIVIFLGILSLSACAKGSATRGPTITQHVNAHTGVMSTISLRIPISVMGLNLSYQHGNRNVLATIFPLSFPSQQNCTAMVATIDEPDIWLHIERTVNLRRKGEGYEFYIPLSYAPYISYIEHDVRIRACGVEFTLYKEQVRQIERFVRSSVLMNRMLEE